VLENILLLALICACGAFVSGLAGFGSGLVLMGTLVAFMDIQVASSITAIISLGLATANIISVWKYVPWNEVWRPAITALPMVWIGVFMLQNLEDSALKGLLAFIIFAGCAVTIWSPGKKEIKSPLWAYATGVVAGFFGGCMNTSGPPVVLYTLLSGWDKKKSKGYMSFLFLILVIIRIILLTRGGLMPSTVVSTGLVLLAPVFVAWYAGKTIFARLSDDRFRWIAVIILIGIAIRLLFTL